MALTFENLFANPVLTQSEGQRTINIVRFCPEEHEVVLEDGWVSHFGIILFSVTDFTGECFHAYCFEHEAPDGINIRSREEAGPVQCFLKSVA